MANVWFFGDSYCAHNENWVKQISKNLNANVANLGVPGSSIGFLLNELLRKHEHIKSNDTVIICATNSLREYFPPVHLQPWSINSLSKKEALGHIEYSLQLSEYASDKDLDIRAEHIYGTYTEYLKHLLNEQHLREKTQAIFTHIYKGILPSLATKKQLVLFSIDSAEYIKYPFMKPYIHELNKDALWLFCADYLITNNYFNTFEECVEYVSTLENHWIDTPDYEYAFWIKFNTYFEKIDAATPVKAKLL